MNNEIKILLVDDHKIIRDVLGRYISENISSNLDQANNGIEAFNMIKKKKYDLVVSDINMPRMDGIELMKEINKYDSELKVIALSMMDDTVSIKKMLKAGAMGYVLKEGNTQELTQAVEDVLNGKHYYSAQVQERIIQSVIDNKKDYKKADLSKRELEILKLIFDENSNQEIAEELFISLRTVETHKHNIMEKTGSKNMASLVKFAIREKLFDDLFY
ncbi:MAG: DNA-binding NarL/FixJ family response regulator [Cyclobacteriaceae bacterium]|jgi:DNA-binding NarL/FixJ family response regulator